MSENKTRYHFDRLYINRPPRFGEVFLLQIGRRYCEPTELIVAHPHLNWFELTIVTKGSGSILTNGVEKHVSSGDIYLSFPCDIHEIRADTNERLEYDFFSFFCEDETLRPALKAITQNHWSCDSRVFQDKKLADLVQLALAEFVNENQPYSSSLLENIFRLIILYLIRDFNDIKPNRGHISESEILCFQLMNYIDTHVYSLKKLEELAPKFNYNYGYLSGLFKRTTGKKLTDYFQHRKMETAKALLLENSKKIGEIAEMLGYTPYAFSKAFKAMYGYSPQVYAKL